MRVISQRILEMSAGLLITPLKFDDHAASTSSPVLFTSHHKTMANKTIP